jgi:2-dehydro-3-deoxyphosphogluconate aldolase/(4S)-4-hydroxy-2-oxoglutarate aldolase
LTEEVATTQRGRHEPLSADELIRKLGAEKIVPVLRTLDPGQLRNQLDMALEAGFGIVEITATSPGWDDLLAEVSQDVSRAGLTLAAGTITTVEDAQKAIAAGAQFLVSPFGVPEVRALTRGRVVLIEGGLSPSEIAAASATNGIAKLFPASTAGVGHLRALRDVLPSCSIMPTGGITIENAPQWLSAGAVAVGMGGGLFRFTPRELRDFRLRIVESDNDEN